MSNISTDSAMWIVKDLRPEAEKVMTDYKLDEDT